MLPQMHAPAAAVIDSFPKLMWDSCSHSKSEPFFFFSCCERLDNLIWFWLEGLYSTWAVFKLRLLWEKYGYNYRDKSWETFLMLAFVFLYAENHEVNFSYIWKTSDTKNHIQNFCWNANWHTDCTRPSSGETLSECFGLLLHYYLMGTMNH